MLRTLAQKLGMMAHGFHGGVHPDEHKLTAGMAIEDCPLASLYILPLKQHIGEACTPLVAVGDKVLRGQKIARAEGYVSVPLHAPTSGTVVKIEEHPVVHPSGMAMPCIFIEADGLDEEDHSLEPMSNWRELEAAVLRERVRMCGIAGLGGAVFPTFIKLVQDQKNPVQTLILNGIECEPYLTNDHQMMLEEAEEILQGMAIIMHMVGAESGIIAIEDNKRDAAEVMQQALARNSEMADVHVAVLPTHYPQGSEKQLIYSLTGKEVPAGKLPLHVGVICQNVGTTKAIRDAVLLGKPLTERLVTVSGDAMPRPANLRVRLGLTLRYVFAQRGLEDFDGIQILHGGPMMGERLRTPDVPVVKSSIGLLAMREDTVMAAHTVEQPCIRCGHCGQACPAGLVPNLMADQCRNEQFEKAESYNLFDCIECGACSYVCPSNIPLVQYFRYGKGQIAQLRRAHDFAEASRQRSEARDARLAREKAEKAARRSRVRKELAPARDKSAAAKPATDKPVADKPANNKAEES
ncbi:MAG: electron transport complex subunit RsxC [Mariprofundaceae bacterium]